MKKVLSTKTLDPDMLAFAKAQNLEVTCVDFIETSALPFGAENINRQSFDAIAFTSANAVKYFFESDRAIDLVKGKHVFALEGKTSAALLARGIKPALQAASADELADAIVRGKICKAVLHVCGNLKLPVLQNKLNGASIAYTALVVYQTTVQTDKKLNEQFDAVLFFSPSGVEGYMSKNNFGNEAVCCCIGSTTSQALREKNKTVTVIVSEQPTPLSMLSAVSNYFQNQRKS